MHSFSDAHWAKVLEQLALSDSQKRQLMQTFELVSNQELAGIHTTRAHGSCMQTREARRRKAGGSNEGGSWEGACVRARVSHSAAPPPPACPISHPGCARHCQSGCWTQAIAGRHGCNDVPLEWWVILRLCFIGRCGAEGKLTSHCLTGDQRQDSNVQADVAQQQARLVKQLAASFRREYGGYFLLTATFLEQV